MADPLSLPIPELARAVRAGELSAERVAEASLSAIARGADLNAFISVSDAAALERARDIDRRRARGEPLGALAGVPIALKDALCTTDAPTTCGSRILTRSAPDAGPPDAKRGWRAPFDATVVARLREADAVLIGKTNMDEFAMGSSNQNSAFGAAKNPWDPSRVPGGSSGGSAVAVAARLVSGALGSDTGGSIRQPAALCGVVGVKPSYGRVSRYGLVAFASSLDQIGPFATDVRSAARLLEVISGPDPADSTAAARPIDGYERACDQDVRGLRVGVPKEYFGEGLDPDVARSVGEVIERLASDGAEIRDVSLPHTHYGVATYYVIATAEASSNLARFDGVRFGLRVEPAGSDLATLYGATRDAGFGAEVKRRILLGTYVLSAGYYDAYYGKAQQVRTLIKRDFDRVFSEVDLVVAPTSPTPAFPLGERLEDPLSMYLADVYTLPASLAGICALSLPCRPAPAREDRPELPVGVQLLGPSFAEARLFGAAAACERAFPPRRPPA
ncbi:MAG TPA: Asp-tRNA(Asn)/Glu-tRNA(Gln) amidotransferase subunit GatA [Polyangiaceae bacterium]|nr:Asp-tRNA(Asn)/Glu-tRNA(Gln) amidotransferase subunit GatA [Polyangiaceae bacterium]